MSRNFTDSDLEKLSELVAAKVEHKRSCHFPESSIDGLKEFAKQIEDPPVRQGIINMAKMFNRTSSLIGNAIIYGIFLLALFSAIFAGWLKFGDKLPR